MPRPLIAQPGSHAWGWLLIAIILTAAILYLGWKLYSLHAPEVECISKETLKRGFRAQGSGFRKTFSLVPPEL